eukprot:COSAG01_NODE_1721_length_9391_cov_5.427249_6_plen_392_part_00
MFLMVYNLRGSIAMSRKSITIAFPVDPRNPVCVQPSGGSARQPPPPQPSCAWSTAARPLAAGWLPALLRAGACRPPTPLPTSYEYSTAGQLHLHGRPCLPGTPSRAAAAAAEMIMSPGGPAVSAGLVTASGSKPRPEAAPTTAAAEFRMEPGFVNGGHACYLNAVVQCLLRVPGRRYRPEWREAMPHGSGRRAAVLRELAQLACAMHEHDASSTDAGVLAPRAPLRTGRLRAALVEWAQQQQQQQQQQRQRQQQRQQAAVTIGIELKADGPNDAADAVEVLIAALQPPQQQPSGVCGDASSATSPAAAASAVIPSLVSSARCLWLPLPEEAPSRWLRCTLQRLPARSVPTRHAVRVSSAGAVRDLCTALAKAARMGGGEPAVSILESVHID